MNAYAEHAEGIAEFIREQAEDCPWFIWNDIQVRCIPSGALRTKAQSQGGFASDADLSATCLVSEFGIGTVEATVNALLRTKLTYLEHAYRIESATPFPGGELVRIKVVDANMA